MRFRFIRLRFPFPAITAAFRERRAVHPPIPDVSPRDVEKIVRRDFPAEQFSEINAVLEGLDRRLDGARVRVAALKLADGSLEALRRQIALANRDYRDVLVAAEYPRYWEAAAKVGLRLKKLSKKERQRIVDADWKQYCDWLQK